MTHPYPIEIFSFVVPLAAVTLFAFWTRWLWRSFRPRVPLHRTLLFAAAFSLGLFLTYRFAFHRYQYNADWQMVGVPIPAVPLERTPWPDGSIFWKDWVGLQMPVGFLGNILFWLLLPYAPITMWVWLFRRPRLAPAPDIQPGNHHFPPC